VNPAASAEAATFWRSTVSTSAASAWSSSNPIRSGPPSGCCAIISGMSGANATGRAGRASHPRADCSPKRPSSRTSA